METSKIHMTVRKVCDTNCTKNSRMERNIHGTKSPSMVRNIYRTKSLWYEKSGSYATDGPNYEVTWTILPLQL